MKFAIEINNRKSSRIIPLTHEYNGIDLDQNEAEKLADIEFTENAV